jgi:hypothetical protein
VQGGGAAVTGSLPQGDVDGDLRRMNQMHGAYPISNEDMRYGCRSDRSRHRSASRAGRSDLFASGFPVGGADLVIVPVAVPATAPTHPDMPRVLVPLALRTVVRGLGLDRGGGAHGANLQ